MTTKHTPGPWRLFDRGDGKTYSRYRVERVDGDKRSVLADINPGWVCEEHGDASANAHLIAAAPTMLEALELIGSEAEYATRYRHGEDGALNRKAITNISAMVKVAIAAAKGGAS